MTQSTLLAHDHSELDSTLAGLVSALFEGDAARSLERLDLFWARLAMHIRAENLYLFPALLRAAELIENRHRVRACRNRKGSGSSSRNCARITILLWLN